MDHNERVRFCRSELEKAQRDFPRDSNELQVAENVYERALIAAVQQGSPTVLGTDLSLSNDSSLRVVFCYDELNVMAAYYNGTKRIGRPRILSHAQAVEIGKRVADTGTYEACPFEVSDSAIRSIGTHLKEYGQTRL